jgi:hypothetical protein
MSKNNKLNFVGLLLSNSKNDKLNSVELWVLLNGLSFLKKKKEFGFVDFHIRFPS